MRTRLIQLFAMMAVCALPACQPASSAGTTGSPADEQAIRDITNKYAAAFGQRDTTAMGALVSDDYEDVDPTGMHTKGKAGFQAALAKEFAMMPAGASMSMTATTDYVRWIDANHAAVGGTWQTSPAMPGMPSKGSFMAVVEKKDNSWKMTSALGAADVSAMMTMPDTTKKPTKKP